MLLRKLTIPAVLTLTAGAVAVGAFAFKPKQTPAIEPVANPTPPPPAFRPAAPVPSSMISQGDARERPERQDREADAARERPEREDDGPRWGGRRRGPDIGSSPMSPDQWADRYEQMRERRQAFMDRFDLNGDGRLDEDEIRAMREQMRQRQRDMMIERMIDRFDLDGDGVLNDEERKLAEAELEARRLEREARLLERFDLDGDGVLSDEELAAAREAFRPREGWGRGPGQGPGDGQFQGQGPGRGDWARMIGRYDLDGDGMLDLDESYQAYLDQFEARERREFVRRYDANGSGTIGASDLEAFLVRFREGDPHADVNGDGVLDQRDVELFRDLMMAVD